MDKSAKFEIPLNIKVPPEKKPRIHFSTMAQAKIDALVFSSNIEVGWHMLMYLDKGIYRVVDIILYPQLATAATVEGDDEHYAHWIASLSDEEFSMLRGQGHSHVNMGVRPSSTDINFYEKMLTVAKDYYLFMIANKRGETEFILYDIKKNLMYYKEDLLLSSDADIWADEQIALNVTKFERSKANGNGSKEELHVFPTGKGY